VILSPISNYFKDILDVARSPTSLRSRGSILCYYLLD